MVKPKLLYLSHNMEGYQAASYQQDVMNEMSRQAHVYFYGPGFKGYDLNDSIDQVLDSAPFDPDAIILGHSWLNDKDEREVDPHPLLQLSNTNILKIAILNKEYTNLNAKLEYIKKNCFDLGFTHHHDSVRYSEITGIKFTFWPFAFDPNRFNCTEKKTIDIGFSGVLQNLNRNAEQSDIRVRIMQFFFHTWMDVPLFKKMNHANTKIFWNSITRKKTGRYLSAILHKRKNLNDDEYAHLIQTTKIFINTLSPMGLVSPRFFESMASRAIVLCEESSLYSKIFPNDLYVSFKNDLSNFEEKIFMLLTNKTNRDQIADKAFRFVHKEHTWEKRVSLMLKSIYHKSSRMMPINQES